MAACVMLLNIAPRRAVPLARTRPLLFDCCVMRHDGRAGKVSVTACSSGKPARPSMASHFISTLLQKTSLAVKINYSALAGLIPRRRRPTSRHRSEQLTIRNIIHQIKGSARPIWSVRQVAQRIIIVARQNKKGSLAPLYLAMALLHAATLAEDIQRLFIYGRIHIPDPQHGGKQVVVRITGIGRLLLQTVEVHPLLFGKTR